MSDQGVPKELKMVNLRWSIVIAVLAACQPVPPEPRIPRAAFSFKPVAWSRTSLEAPAASTVR